MESKKINQLATELTPALDDLTIIGDPTTGVSKKITLSQMASLFTGTVEEYANFAAFPLVGVTDTIYIALDTNVLYRWNTGTNAYVELSPNIINSLVFSDANGFDGNIALVGSTATLTITTALTTGSVPFIGASGALSQDNANLFFDDTNNRLGINTNAPTTALDVFGSGIIGRINGTSTNNAFLGFSSAGSNKWSIGNVQSDHRFRIYNEATTSELVTVLQTGEFGIGIANPTTKIHIDGGATALIANLDANVSVAKSISFRSDNSNRINLEVSGTESGSNAGANFFLRTYTDAGALLNTPLTITRSNANVSFSTSIDVASTLLLSGTTIEQNTSAGLTLNASNTSGAIYFRTNGAQRLSIGSSGIATFSSTITATKITAQESNSSGSTEMVITNTSSVSATTKTAQLLFKLADTAGTLKDSGYIKSFPEGVNVLDSGLSFGTRNSDTTSDKMFLSSSGILSFGGANIVQSTDKPHFFRMSGGGLGISANNEGSGNQPINFYTSGSPRLTVTSVGYVGIANSNPGSSLDVSGTIRTRTAGSAAAILLQSAAQSNKWEIGYEDTSDNLYIYSYGSGTSPFRMTPTGQPLLNTSSVLTSGWLCISVNSNNYNAIVLRDTGTTYSAGNYYQVFTNSSNTISGSISHNTITGVNFNTSSDYRLKEDFKDFNGLDILSNIKFYDFKWKEEDKRMHGVIAHELESIIPLAVSGIKDAIDEEANIIAQGVDYSKIVPILGKAIQELKAEVEQLKALINK
jgi:hypothetical protein